MVKRFIECYKDEDVATEYEAGYIVKDMDEYVITGQMKGAEETFSIGQPIYDREHNLMGYLGISLYHSLDYSTDNGMRIPVEKWVVLLPTKYCDQGKWVVTYWQNKKGEA